LVQVSQLHGMLSCFVNNFHNPLTKDSPSAIGVKSATLSCQAERSATYI